MIALPLPLVVLGWALTLTVVYLAWAFWSDSSRGLAFATHRTEALPRVMVNRYFVIFMFMGGAMVSRDPLWIAYAFLVNGIAPLWDALIYRHAGQPYHKHLVPAALSFIVAGWAFYLYSMTGEA
ncbi:MAG TPA: hypothetical protein ENK28_13045 [Aliiroseovarius sp.]|nr:hypothetical protein [Aliiroseovarius sp.]